MFRDINALCVRPTDALRPAIARIDAGTCGILLVTDDERRLIGTITDGDVRRAILAGIDLNLPIEVFLARKGETVPAVPITALAGTPPDTLLALMSVNVVRQIPLLDARGRVVDLVVLEDLVLSPEPAMEAVIMAGGFGTRLLPLTQEVPKPMLPVGGRPLLEHIIEQLHRAGIRDVNVSAHYRPDRIIDHFGDGQAFGVNLNYVVEDQPLGTGGALGLLSRPDGTQLVINGDILTRVDFRAMLAFHRENKAEMTIAVRSHEVTLPYGVIEAKGAHVASLREKPTMSYLVNAGMYLLEPSVYDLITGGSSFHMTDLVNWLLEKGRTVISFPIREYWLDVGEHKEYAQAQFDIENGRVTG